MYLTMYCGFSVFVTYILSEPFAGICDQQSTYFSVLSYIIHNVLDNLADNTIEQSSHAHGKVGITVLLNLDHAFLLVDFLCIRLGFA